MIGKVEVYLKLKKTLLKEMNVRFENKVLSIDGENIDTLKYGYELIDLVNNGANGIILRAREIVTRKDVALKIWLNKRNDSSIQAAKEIAKIEILDDDSYSPYMVRYRGSGLFGKYNYCAMDYLEPMRYVTLKEYFEDSYGKMADICKRYNIITQIVSGLRYAHEHNIYHGDLHADNIMIEKNSGKVKIVDFGTSFRDKKYSRERDNKLMMKTSSFVWGEYYNNDILMNINYVDMPSNAIRLIIKAMSKIIVLNSFWKGGHNEELIKSIGFFCVLVPFFNLDRMADMLFCDNNKFDEKYQKIYLDTIIEYMARFGIIVLDDENRGELNIKYIELQKRFLKVCSESLSEVDIYEHCAWDEIKRFNENLYSEEITEREEIQRILE